MAKRVHFKKDWLAHKYINQNLSLKQIAAIKKCSISTVNRAIFFYGIKKNPKLKVKSKYNISKQMLITEYIHKQKSQKEIAEMFGCGQALICYYMKKYKIKSRSYEENLVLGKHPMLGKENKWGRHTAKTKQKISKLLSGKNNPMWGKKLSQAQKEKLSKIFSGKNNPMWGKRGKNSPVYKPPEKRLSNLYKQIRNSSKGRQWTQKCYARDEYTCQNCGDDKGGNLNAHHIKMISEIVKEYKIENLEQAYKCDMLWKQGNGITLCEDCHMSIHKKNSKKYGEK